MKRIYRYDKNQEFGEDATLFGEFVCSCHMWLPVDSQKENAKRLEEITKIRK